VSKPINQKKTRDLPLLSKFQFAKEARMNLTHEQKVKLGCILVVVGLVIWIGGTLLLKTPVFIIGLIIAVIGENFFFDEF